MKSTQKARSRIGLLLFAATVFALALAPRLWRIDAHLTPDELRWVCQSLAFHTGLKEGDFGLTLQSGHPGVITMLVGGLGLPVDRDAAWSKACFDSVSSEYLYELGPRDRQVILDRLYDGRRRLAVFTALCVVMVTLLAGRLFGAPLALVAAPLLALDPLWLAHSRLLHLDGALAGLMAIAILCLTVYLTGPPRHRWLVASGIALGLAIAQKSPGLFVLGFAPVAWLGTLRRRPATLLTVALEGTVWLVAAAAAVVVIWPAMWVEPVAAVRLVLERSYHLGSSPLDSNNFFAGSVRDDPGLLFYLPTWLLRTSPWLAVAAVVAAIGVVARQVGRRRSAGRAATAPAAFDLVPESAPDPALAPPPSPSSTGAALTDAPVRAMRMRLLLASCVVLTALFSIGALKGDRYLLPAFPAADILAAVVLVGAISWVRGPLARRAVPVLAGVVLATQLAMVLPIGPYWVTWYNPLFGGARQAENWTLVGWGEGLDQAAAYLNAQPHAADLEVASRYRAALALLLRGTNIQTERFAPDTTDYLVVMLNQVQRHQDPELLGRYWNVEPPVFTAEIGGSTLAWVYRNRADEAVAAYLGAHADPATDAIVVRERNILVRRYAGPLSIVTYGDEMDDEAMARRLADAFGEQPRLWHVHRPERERSPADERMTRLLETGARRFASDVVGDLVVDGYAGAVPRTLQPLVPRTLQIDFGSGGVLSLRALGLPEDPWPADRQAALTFSWRAGVAIDPPATLSAQLFDAAGAKVAQLDEKLVDAAGHTSSDWSPGAEVTTQHALDVRGLPAGAYTLSVGVYTVRDGHWETLPTEQIDIADLVAAGSQARVEGDRLLVPIHLAAEAATAP